MKLMKAIIGDICGSYYEFNRIKVKEKPSNLMLDNCHFTDDTVCTVAIAEAILENPDNPDFDKFLRRYVQLYPKAGYGRRFVDWAFDEGPGDSYGNGCCMRQYPISLYYLELFERRAMLAKSCSGSHNHPLSYMYTNLLDNYIHMQDAINQGGLNIVQEAFNYEFNLEKYRKTYKFDCTCQGSVSEAIAIGCKSLSYEDCITDAIYLGGDMDTIACMAGMVTKFEPSKELEKWAFNKLPERMQNVIIKFDHEITKFN